jgi:hypothetical protein
MFVVPKGAAESASIRFLEEVAARARHGLVRIRPAARNAATNSPWGVSIATGISASALAPSSANIAISSANPSTDSLILRLATSLPSSSTSAMS